MTETQAATKKVTNVAGAIGLASAIIGLLGTALAVWSGSRHDATERSAEGSPQLIAQEDLSKVPSMIDGYMSGPAFQTLLGSNTLCYDWRPAKGTCQLAAHASQRSGRAVRMSATQAVRLYLPLYRPTDMILAADIREQGESVPEAFIQAEETDYKITSRGICTTNSQRETDTGRVQIFAIDAGGAWTPLTTSGLTAYRAALAEQYHTEAVGDEQCWRYKFEPASRDRVRQDYFIDGVLQRDQALEHFAI